MVRLELLRYRPAVKTRRHRFPPFLPWPPTILAKLLICTLNRASLSGNLLVVNLQCLCMQSFIHSLPAFVRSQRNAAQVAMHHRRVRLTSSFCFSMLIMALKSWPPGTDLSLVAFFKSSTSGREVLWPVRECAGLTLIHECYPNSSSLTIAQAECEVPHACLPEDANAPATEPETAACALILRVLGCSLYLTDSLHQRYNITL